MKTLIHAERMDRALQ